VKAEEEIEDFSNDEHYQLATVFSCSCDTNGDGLISTLEIHQGKFCKRVFSRFLNLEDPNIGALDINRDRFISVDEIVAGLKQEQSSSAADLFNNYQIELSDNDGTWQAPTPEDVPSIEAIIRCACDKDNDNQGTFSELSDNRPVYNLIYMLLGLRITEEDFTQADTSQNGKVVAEESISFINLKYEL